MSGPGGYGVTTLLLQVTAGTEVVWVSLDEEVPDQQARALFATALGVDGGVDQALAALARTGACWVVVDGIDPEVHSGLVTDLNHIADHLPSGARLLIGSHHNYPTLPAAVRVGARDLAFTPDEAVRLLEALHPGIDIEDAQSIIDLAQGWPAALVAASRHLRTDRDPTWLGKAGAPVLLDPWFRRLTDDQRRFLVDTSILQTLSADLAGAVARYPEPGRMLLTLEAHNAYLQEVAPPPGGSGRWWRRHRLLTAYLENLAGADRLPAHSRAADFFMATENVAAAMHHLIAAGRTEDAGAYLFARESRLLSGQADPAEVVRWYEQVATDPDQIPVHLLRLGWGLALSGEIVAADSTLSRLRTHLAVRQQHDAELPGSATVSVIGELALLEAYLAAFHADPAGVIKGARRRMLEPQARDEPADGDQLAPILMARGLLWCGQPQAAARSLAVVLDRPFPNDVLRETQLASIRALVNLANGYVRRGKVVIDTAKAWMTAAGMPATVARFEPAWTASAFAAMELGDAAKAPELFASVTDAALNRHMLAEAVYAQCLSAQALVYLQDFAGATQTLRRARELATMDTPDSGMQVLIDQAQALVHICAGDAVRAERLIRALPPSDQRSLLWARLGLARHPGVARRTLEAVSPGVPRLEVERHLLLAAVHVRTSRSLAEAHLRKAATVAQTHGLAQSLATFDAAMLDFAESVAGEQQDDNLAWLLSFRTAGHPVVHAAAPHMGLSRGEMQLLGFLPTRAKNADIAAELGVSVNTIKTRLRRLYAKLGVSSRDEAIAVADARGLVRE